MLDISLILALAVVACSDHRYFSMSVALIAAVDNDPVIDISSCIEIESGKIYSERVTTLKGRDFKGRQKNVTVMTMLSE